MVAQYEDGQLVHLMPSELKDMRLGGNTRRKKRANWDSFVESIRSQGVLQSVVGRLMPDGSIELLAGYGRRDAAIEAKIVEVPTLIRICDDATALQINLAENMERADLSFSDQVVWAQRFISLYNGDVASAAQRLSWSESKLRERLSLAPCTEGVLDALDDGSINVKHALILAAFEDRIQNATLSKVVAEKWSVSELKQRADRVQVPLAKAIFDRGDCNQCRHNTELQAGLFGMDDSALCSKSSCFHAKTKAALETAKTEAVEKYGTVVWLSQSLPEHRSTVTASIVGQTQFDTGCMACSDRVAVMDDAPHGQPGAIMESQCTNGSCFSECTSAHEAYLAAKQSPSNDIAPDDQEASADTGTDTTDESQQEPVTSIKKAPAVKKGVVSQVLIDTHWRELRDSGAKVLATNRKFSLVMQLLGVMEISKFKAIGDPAKKMNTLMAMPDDKLESMIAQVVEYCAVKAGAINGYDATKVVTAATVEVDGGKDALVASWVPTKETLDKYTTLGLTQIIQMSGLEKHCEAKEKGSGKALSKGKKSDVIAQILAVTDFDWTHFAPLAYLDLIGTFVADGSKAA